MTHKEINSILSKVDKRLPKEFWVRVDTDLPIPNIKTLYSVVVCLIDWSDSSIDYNTWDELHLHLLSKINNKLTKA